MQIDNGQILELLRSQGDAGKAAEADSQLPYQVDTDQHGDLLARFGLNPQDLIARFAGGGGGGGLGGLLGG